MIYNWMKLRIVKQKLYGYLRGGINMLENVVLGILIMVEISFAAIGLWKNSNLKREKSFVRISLFALFLLLVISPIIDWSFRWTSLGLFLGIQALLGIFVLVRRRENSASKKSRLIFTGLNRILLIVMAVLPALILPQYSPIEPTGDYSVGTVSYTLTDESREEYFTDEKDNRKVTVQYWYPENKSGQEQTVAKGKFPLVVFSHGSFGYRMSNYSTFEELASHGYIVCSIDHTYHSFMTKQEDGKAVIVNNDFLNSVIAATNEDISAEEIYKLEQEWMKLRTGDMAFVLDYIKKTASSINSDPVYQSMDLEHIGVFGHSLGGATAAQLGRLDKDVDAVVVVDGTMLGERTGYENGRSLLTDVPYPKPLMNIYSESHYNKALENQDEYANMVAGRNALSSYQVVIKGSEHMNFTDLPIVSPLLSGMLGTGKVDARYCIETTNKDILEFFDYYLKSGNIQIAQERFH
jgi:dienelactone hydrolase